VDGREGGKLGIVEHKLRLSKDRNINLIKRARACEVKRAQGSSEMPVTTAISDLGQMLATLAPHLHVEPVVYVALPPGVRPEVGWDDAGLIGVGLTAAFAAALGAAGTRCNVIAAACHDHILVPPSDAARHALGRGAAHV
jgi:hypothetical protein